jgi:hypothetical protein
MKNRTPKYYTTNEGGLKKKPDLYGKKRKLETEKKTNGPINRVFQEKKPKFCGRKPENGKKKSLNGMEFLRNILTISSQFLFPHRVVK